MKKNRGAKARRGCGVPRLDLARALGISARKTDRLIAAGLKPTGTRGAAKLYNLAAARRLARRLAPEESTAADVLIGDYRSHAEDLSDRRQRLLATWVPDAQWLPAWRALVAVVARITRPWPTRLAERIAATPREEAHRLYAADEPRVPPTPPWPGWKDAETLVAELLADESAWPRVEGDVLAVAARRVTASDDGERAWLARREAIGRGVVIQDGCWHRPQPGARPWPDPATGDTVRALDRAEAERRASPPLVRPLLDELAPSAEASLAALAAALAPPAAEPLPPAPAAVAEARAQWREARAAFRRVRVAIRRGHHRRDEVVARIGAAARAHTMAWWTARAQFAQRAGDQAAARSFTESLRREALAALATLAGLLPAEHREDTTPEEEPMTAKKVKKPGTKPPALRRAPRVVVDTPSLIPAWAEGFKPESKRRTEQHRQHPAPAQRKTEMRTPR